MSPLDDGSGGWLLLLLAGVLVHEPWRWAGLLLGRTVPADSEVFRWVRAVATALVAGLVMRLVLFPAGALATVSLSVRLAAFGAGLLAFFALGRSLGIGVAASALVLIAAGIAGLT
jgi:hypothetical protein